MIFDRGDRIKFEKKSGLWDILLGQFLKTLWDSFSEYFKNFQDFSRNFIFLIKRFQKFQKLSRNFQFSGTRDDLGGCVSERFSPSPLFGPYF